MASTITAGTLTVKITETIALNGTNMDATNSLVINSINEISQRILTVPDGNIIVVFEFGASVGSGTFIKGDVKYIRITNKDDTNPVDINLATASSNQWTRLEAAKSFIVSGATNMSEGVSSSSVTASVVADLVKLSAYIPQGDPPVDIDCYVAMT
jgi:hypothetical protein